MCITSIRRLGAPVESRDIRHHVVLVTAALAPNRRRTDGGSMRKEEISIEEIEEPGEPVAEFSPFENDVVDEIGAALGVTYADDEVLSAGEKEAERDAHRWELDPASSEDYAERSRQRTAGPADKILHMKHHDRYQE
jgi:hypothetical protein